MFDTIHNNSNCDFAADMVLYLYGEIGAREKIEFEAHLDSCSSCAEELAGFGLVRSVMFEWKDEFSALPTPRFVFPAEKPKNLSAANFNSTPKNSWLDRLGKIFAFPPARAFTAFAALAICIGLTIFAFNFSNNLNNSEVAESEIIKNGAPVTSPTAVKQIKESDKSDITKNDSFEKKSELRDQKVENTAPDAFESAHKNPSAAKEPPVKVSANSRKTKIDNKPSQNSTDLPKTDNYRENKKALPVQAGNAPKLVDDDDAEDDSVRLADLFDEIDTR